MAKLRLIHSFPTVYYMPHSDKRFKNWSENNTEKVAYSFFDEKFTRLSTAVPLLQKEQCPRVERAVRKCGQNNYSANIGIIDGLYI